ncbi:MAG: DUF2760 domain-containing protein [Polyangiaceae bacterium]|nr:DUF2760 domain-containing protein [Polyangiaceae bacterium]
MADDRVAFFWRPWLALACFVRVLFDGHYAALVQRAARGELNRVTEPPMDNRMTQPTLPDGVAPSPGREPSVEAALQLLGVLQREGRFVDFLEQDISGFEDMAVGAAARVVHEGCRRALRSRAHIVPVRQEPEGATIELEEGFDPAAIKLTGNVGAAEPKRGVLKHRGWRAESFQLPQAVGSHDATILAPAEVDL